MNYTSGSVLGVALSTSTFSLAAKDISTQPNTLTSTSPAIALTEAPAPAPALTQRTSSGLPTATGVPSTDQASENAATSARSQSQSSSLPSAIGAGIGVPLGIAAVGFIGFLYSRHVKSKDKRKAQSSSHESRVKADVGRLRTELHNIPLPYEMDDDGRPELPGSQLVLKIVPGT